MSEVLFKIFVFFSKKDFQNRIDKFLQYSYKDEWKLTILVNIMCINRNKFSLKKYIYHLKNP